jgi:hypothetical protein
MKTQSRRLEFGKSAWETWCSRSWRSEFKTWKRYCSEHLNSSYQTVDAEIKFYLIHSTIEEYNANNGSKLSVPIRYSKMAPIPLKFVRQVIFTITV